MATGFTAADHLAARATGRSLDELEEAVAALERCVKEALRAAAGRRRRDGGGVRRAESEGGDGAEGCKGCQRLEEATVDWEERLRVARLAALGAKNEAARRMRRDEVRLRRAAQCGADCCGSRSGSRGALCE